MRNQGRVLTRTQILDHIWGYDYATDSNLVDVYMAYLRRKVDRGSWPQTDPHRAWHRLRARRLTMFSRARWRLTLSFAGVLAAHHRPHRRRRSLHRPPRAVRPGER